MQHKTEDLHFIKSTSKNALPETSCLRDAIKKKIENFGGNVLKGGRGSFQKPNFIIPLIWDILGWREGVKSLIFQFF